MKNRFLLLLFALLPLLSTGQVRYKASKNSAGQQIIRRESVLGSGVFDVVSGTIPSDAVRARLGGRVLIPYATEGIRVLNVDQFGLDRYYDPNFKFSIDFRPDTKSLDDLRRQGQNLFNSFLTTESERNTLPFGQGMIYDTESGIHGAYEGALYYERSLAELEQYFQGSIPGPVKGYWTANIENSNEWWPGNVNNPLSGFNGKASYGNNKYPENWSSAQNKTITLESTGEQNVSLGTLANRGFGAWQNEMITRRTNRIKVMLQIARQRSSAGGFYAYGSSMYQGQPNLATAYQTGVFQDGNANVSNIGGDGNGNINLNGRQYQLQNDIYRDENLHLDYYYQFTFTIGQTDYQQIFQNQDADKVNYPYIWGKIKPRHVVADQIGHFQANKFRMLNRPGQSLRPVLVMRELVYEADRAGYVEGINSDQGLIGRVPSNMNAGCLDFQDGGSTCDDSPKIWIPPYEQYSYYVCARFYFANQAGSGFHLFNAPGKLNLATFQGGNHHLHAVTALWQARHDMQPYERFLGASTLIETPEVQQNQSGNYESYDAIQAYNYNNGSFGTQKSCYQVRYLAQAGGYRVLILGGTNQSHGTERTDNVRVTLPGMSGPVTFAVKLRGPAAQVFEFAVNASQDANQTFTAQFNAQSNWEKAGYAGRVN